MCGIVGAIADRNVVPVLVDGLRRLEYRGYDSAGLAIINGGTLERRRTPGKVSTLEALLKSDPVEGSTGVAHTRWATHGVPNEINAHPHVANGRIAVVHNGIIENHEVLRRELKAQGVSFDSDTDTEVIAKLVYHYSQQGMDLLDAVKNAVSRLEGAYAIGVIDRDRPERVIGARLGSPLVVGYGSGENFIASDIGALVAVTQRFSVLEDGDIVEITKTAARVFDAEGRSIERRERMSQLNADAVERGDYRHYMQKEIFEQPEAIASTLEGRLGKGRVLEAAFGPRAAEVFDRVKSIQILACGTSYHAGLVARNWFEGLAGVPCRVEVASEFRYRHPVPQPDCLVVAISQSGETLDTLEALRYAKKLGFGPTLAIVNAPESSLTRESDLVFMTRAGPEIGVASTKAFTTQLVSLLMLVTVIGRRHAIGDNLERHIVEQLLHLPKACEQVLRRDEHINILSSKFADKHHALFLGRGVQYPVAMEGALKLKEISYIHAEAYPAGELKHGPLALVDADMPVIVVAPNDALLEKLKSNMQEVRARGGVLYVFADSKSGVKPAPGVHVIEIDPAGENVTPIVYSIPLQLLAYHVAVLKGTDVDQPRNLAKSVTVE
ncbi:MAG: glutamine--fructose-6-phosphate transaminase (isomerizing) [Gammaproteobacteria bacterium]|nr:glutamine--fructose-6-phosphate transaminase (isomerizing) [Gammaproteobacteria bacterium]MDH3411941.1 glutamine--fructose-6-phosphate transaminase (isomerizing) [Gammaproteobacteria bacterium]